MKASTLPLEARFRARVARRSRWEDGDTIVVAASGGLDSTVLAHLLRFTRGLPACTLVLAHLDHAMRPASKEDARWLNGLALAWDLPLRSERLDPPPRAEAEAREARYAFLSRVREEEGARWVVTAHQADDQAETVLFRAARGAAIGGLRGIRERPSTVMWRPLLPFFRAELEAYATRVGLSWREDPTNREAYPRNVLRHTILPALESSVAPGARRSLARLALRARENEVAWARVLPGLLTAADLLVHAQAVSVDRDAFVRYHPAVRARLVRHMAQRLGADPSAAGTRRAVEFSSSGASGGEVPLGRDVVLRRDLDRLVVLVPRRGSSDEIACIPDAAEGIARGSVGGRSLRVSWGPSRTGESVEESFEASALRFPLVVRGWRAGDRVRLPYGEKKLKKLLLEARVPASDRGRLPVLADGDDTVLWVPGVARSMRARPGDDDEALFIRINDASYD